MPPSAQSRVLYHPLPPGAEDVAGIERWTAALDDCDPDAATRAIGEGDDAPRAALRAVAEVARARWGLAGASLDRAGRAAGIAIRAADTPLGRYAAGLVASWAARIDEAEDHLSRAVDACGQPFAAEILAQIRIDRRNLDGAEHALGRIPAIHARLRGVVWTRARLEAARGSDAKAGVLACEVLAEEEVAPDATNLDIVLHELPEERRVQFLRNLHAKTGSALVRGRLCHLEALAATPSLRVVDRVGARRWTRTIVAALVPGRRPPAPLVLLLLVVLLPVALVRLLLVPWPLHRFLVHHERAAIATGQNPVLPLPRDGRVTVTLWTSLIFSSVLAVLQHPLWWPLAAVAAIVLSWNLLSIESALPSM